MVNQMVKKLKNIILIMITLAYVLTFSGMLSLYLMRASTEHMNETINEGLKVGKSGLEQVLSYSYFIGAGACLYHLFFPFTRPIYACGLNTMISGATLALLYPFAISGAKMAVLFLALAYSWGTATILPLTIVVIIRHHSLSEGRLMGFWAGASNVGCLLRYSLSIHFPYGIVISGIFSILASFALCGGRIESEDQQCATPTLDFSQQVHQFCLFACRLDHYLSLVISTLLFASTHVLLSLQHYSPIWMCCFCLFAVAGTILLSWLYQQLNHRVWQLMASNTCVVLGLGITFLLDRLVLFEDEGLGLGLISLLGFLLGGACNISCVHEPILLAYNSGLHLQFILMLSSVAWNFTCGIFSFYLPTTQNHFLLFLLIIPCLLISQNFSILSLGVSAIAFVIFLLHLAYEIFSVQNPQLSVFIQYCENGEEGEGIRIGIHYQCFQNHSIDNSDKKVL